MIKSIKAYTYMLTLILFAFSISQAFSADKKVVVVPMFGDDAASKWRGAWVIGTEYKKGDLVENFGSSYIALSDHTADGINIPSNLTFWDTVAASGANGLDGGFGDLWVDGASTVPFTSEISIAGPDFVLAERTVPRGNYLVFAKATVVDNDDFIGEACWIDVNGITVDRWISATTSASGFRTNVMLTTHIGSTFSDAKVQFSCSGGRDAIRGDDAANFIKLKIVQIGSIHLIDGTVISPPDS